MECPLAGNELDFGDGWSHASVQSTRWPMVLVWGCWARKQRHHHALKAPPFEGGGDGGDGGDGRKLDGRKLILPKEATLGTSPVHRPPPPRCAGGRRVVGSTGFGEACATSWGLRTLFLRSGQHVCDEGWLASGTVGPARLHAGVGRIHSVALGVLKTTECSALLSTRGSWKP